MGSGSIGWYLPVIWKQFPSLCILSLMLVLNGPTCAAVNPNNTAIILGQPLTLLCDITAGTGTNFLWYTITPSGSTVLIIGICSGQPTQPGYSFDTSSGNGCNLVMDSVSEVQATHYRCDRNGGDTASCSVAALDPSGLIIMSDPAPDAENIVHLNEQESVNIFCSVQYFGSVNVNIEWIADGLNLSSSRQEPIAGGINSTGTFTSFGPGNYTVTCSASFNSTSTALDSDKSIPEIFSNNSITIRFSEATTIPTNPLSTANDIQSTTESTEKGNSTSVTSTEESTTTPAPPPDTGTPPGEGTTGPPLPCDCHICRYNCIEECQPEEIVVFVFSGLTGVSAIGTIISLFVQMQILQYVLTSSCSVCLIIIIAVGCSFYKCIEQLIVMISFSVIGGIAVIIAISYFVYRCCKAGSRVNSRKSSRSSSHHNNVNLSGEGVSTANVYLDSENNQEHNM